MLTNTPRNDILLDSEREADFLSKRLAQSRSGELNRFPFADRNAPFLLEADMIIYSRRYKVKVKKERPWYYHLLMARSRCNNKSSRYTQRGIKCLLTEQEIKDIWFRDKAYFLNKPSLDRKDGYGNYTKDNCRFIELSLNRKIASYRVNCKVRPWEHTPVNQYDLKGNFIKKWNSQTEAGEKLNIWFTGISACATGRYKTSGGFIWRNAK